MRTALVILGVALAGLVGFYGVYTLWLRPVYSKPLIVEAKIGNDGAVYIFLRNEGKGPVVVESIELDNTPIDLEGEAEILNAKSALLDQGVLKMAGGGEAVLRIRFVDSLPAALASTVTVKYVYAGTPVYVSAEITG